MTAARLVTLADMAERLAGNVPPWPRQGGTPESRPWELEVYGLWMACYGPSQNSPMDPGLKNALMPGEVQPVHEHIFQLMWNAVTHHNQEWERAGERLRALAGTFRTGAARIAAGPGGDVHIKAGAGGPAGAGGDVSTKAGDGAPSMVRPSTDDPLGEVTPAQRKILDSVADNLAKEEWISGRRLRVTLSGIDRAGTAEVIRSLVPQYLRRQGSEPEDHYAPTLDGLLQSRQTARASHLIEAVLRFLRRRLHDEPDFREYTWDEIKVAVSGLSGADYEFVRSVISTCELLNGGSGSPGPPPHYRWGRPTDIERVAECGDIVQFLELRRRQRAEREARTTIEPPDFDEDDAGEEGIVLANRRAALDQYLRERHSTTLTQVERRFRPVRDQRLRKVLRENALEAVDLLRCDFYKPALIAAATVIEGLLHDALAGVPRANLDPAFQKVHPSWNGPTPDPGDYKFGQLIDVCEGVGKLERATARLLHGVRDFRNFVHARAEAKQRRPVGRQESEMAVRGLLMLLGL